jgi:hypothetical protein
LFVADEEPWLDEEQPWPGHRGRFIGDLQPLFAETLLLLDEREP